MTHIDQNVMTYHDMSMTHMGHINDTYGTHIDQNVMT